MNKRGLARRSAWDNPQSIVFCIVGTGGLAAARSQNGSCIINAIHYRSATSLPRRSVWDNPQSIVFCIVGTGVHDGPCGITHRASPAHQRQATPMPPSGREVGFVLIQHAKIKHCPRTKHGRSQRKALYPLCKPSRVILSERMRVEALRSAGGAKPRNEVTKGSCKGYSQPVLLLLFATKERDPSTPLRSAQDDTKRDAPALFKRSFDSTPFRSG